MSIINVSELTFGYDSSAENVFENVSFRLDTSWRTGLVGRNGRGKTTLLKLLCGEYEYSGSITSDADFFYFPFTVRDPGQNTIDILYEVSPDMEYWQLQKELSLLRTDEDALWRPFSSLSSGERTKMLLAALFLRDNGFLLIDEPTNHLDAHAREIVGKYLSSKNGFLLVSHDRAFLDSCIDHVISINRRDITVRKTDFSGWLREKEALDRAEAAENEHLKKEISRLKSAASRTASWSDKMEKTKYGSNGDRGYIGHRAAKMMKRSKAIERRRLEAAKEKAALLKNTDAIESIKLRTLEYRSQTLISLQDVSLFYEEKEVCSAVSLQIKRGDRIAVIGTNGCGKSTLLKLLCGEDIRHSGVIERGSGLVISYVPQDTDYLSGTPRKIAAQSGIEESFFMTMLRKLGFSREDIFRDVSSMSIGQRKKVAIAKSLCQSAHLYVWDEPLNYIDIQSRLQLEELIKQSCPTMIFVEHDAAFCREAATKTIAL